VAKGPTIRTALAQRLDASVQLIDPWRQVTSNPKVFAPEYLQAVGPLFTVAVGLAMRRVGDK
jgi:type IV pilus assembly protein PilM